MIRETVRKAGAGIIGNYSFCTTTQESIGKHQYEIEAELNLSRANINKIFSNLQTEGYISMITRGRWKVFDDAIHLIEVTRQL